MQRALAEEGLGLDALRDHLRRTQALAREAQALEARWKGPRGDVIYGPEARRLDAELDRVLGALDASLQLTLRAFGPGSPRGDAAVDARECLFPHGVAHVIRLPYVEAAEQVRRLLAQVDQDPELAKSLGELGVAPLLERLREVHARYVQALRRPPPLPFAEVQQAREALHERFCAVVALVVGLGALSEPGSAEAQALTRARHVVAEQNRALGIAHRRRRRGEREHEERAVAHAAPEPPTEADVAAPGASQSPRATRATLLGFRSAYAPARRDRTRARWPGHRQRGLGAAGSGARRPPAPWQGEGRRFGALEAGGIPALAVSVLALAQ
ncbi:MAG: hypothetical protein R3F62_22945 [Planctomycetota bacterium]